MYMPETHPFWQEAKVNKQRIRGTLKFWRKLRGVDDKGEFYLIYGSLYTPDGELLVSKMFRTSMVVHINDEETMCETLNSLYKLEDKLATDKETTT